MKKFNEHILLVMRWLLNPDSVSKEELKSNSDSAWNTHHPNNITNTTTLNADASLKIVTRGVAIRAARANEYFTVNANATADFEFWLAQTKERLDEYFELTGEDKQEYKKRALHLNILN